MSLSVHGVDYAWSHPSPDALKRGGYRFAMRYLSHDSGKNLSRSEHASLVARGISVGLVWESTAARALSGWAGGRADAQAADQLVRALGLAGIPVYFAVDFDAGQGQMGAISNYLRGAASAIGRNRVGVYAGYWVVRHMADNRVCDYFWQTYAWSGGRLDHRADVYQYRNGVSIGGGDCDLNLARPNPSLRGPGMPSPEIRTAREVFLCQRRCYHRNRHLRHVGRPADWVRNKFWSGWYKVQIRVQMHAIQVRARASGGYGSRESRRLHRAARYQLLAGYWTGKAC